MDDRRVRVLIADDEQYICTLLQQIIRWDDLNLELGGVSNNGVELMEMIIDRRPDIVVTDISMPEMDGIELIRQVRLKGIDCRFIIVSGYRLFEYAHNALKYNVEDYILKPIDEDELNDRLREMASDIIRHGNGEQNAPLSGNEGYRRLFLKRVVRELDKVDTSLAAIREEYGIAFIEGFYQCICVVLDVISSQEGHTDEQNNFSKKIALSIQRFLQKSCAEILIDTDANLTMVALNYPSSQGKAVAEAVQACFAYLSDTAALFSGMKVTVGIGMPFESLLLLNRSREQAANAILARIVVGLDRVICYQDLQQPASSLATGERDRLLAQLRRNCEGWSADGFTATTTELFALVRDPFCPEEAHAIYDVVVELFFEACGEMVRAHSNEDYLRKQIDYGMKTATTVDEMENAICTPILAVIATLINEVTLQRTKPIRQIVQYIEEHYGEAVRLEEVAKQVNFSPNYVCNLFRKEMRVGVSDYLLSVRIRKAKELLRKSDDNIAEIAERVGYSDARHFSKVFRKAVGIKPTEYRKIHG